MAESRADIANYLSDNSQGARKASICRSNRCGHYNADRDACQLLIDKGRAGRVAYLLTHPATKCVADEPLF